MLRGDVYHQSSSNYADANCDTTINAWSLSSRIPAYTIVNGRIAWNDVSGKPGSVAVFGRNLLDEQYIVGISSAARTSR